MKTGVSVGGGGAPGDSKVTICVRKRPINRKEIRKNDHDSVTCLNPKVGRVD